MNVLDKPTYVLIFISFLWDRPKVSRRCLVPLKEAFILTDLPVIWLCAGRKFPDVTDDLMKMQSNGSQSRNGCILCRIIKIKWSLSIDHFYSIFFASLRCNSKFNRNILYYGILMFIKYERNAISITVWMKNCNGSTSSHELYICWVHLTWRIRDVRLTRITVCHYNEVCEFNEKILILNDE